MQDKSFEIRTKKHINVHASDKYKRYYTSTPKLLKQYAAMVLPVEEQE